MKTQPIKVLLPIALFVRFSTHGLSILCDLYWATANLRRSGFPDYPSQSNISLIANSNTLLNPIVDLPWSLHRCSLTIGYLMIQLLPSCLWLFVCVCVCLFVCSAIICIGWISNSFWDLFVSESTLSWLVLQRAMALLKSHHEFNWIIRNWDESCFEWTLSLATDLNGSCYVRYRRLIWIYRVIWEAAIRLRGIDVAKTK